jgi:hypothetical protein
MLFAHHVAVELFGREFSPHTTFEHVCAFGGVGLILALAAYGGWTLVVKLLAAQRTRRRV